MAESEPKISSFSSAEELDERSSFAELFAAAPIPREELISNLPLFVKRQDLSRALFLHELYRRILDVHGVVIEFGVRWGRDLALLMSFRGMYEPYNYSRRVVGFDTFEGFPSVHTKDGAANSIEVGAYDVTSDYQAYLERVLAYHERESPISHLRKFELVKGDATVEIERYLERHPETIVALAYFDLDLYESTAACLEAIRPYLTKGSVIGFDELNCPDFPGETIAVKEALGLDRFAIRRFPGLSFPSYLVVE
jgi:hypothetical protein